MRAAATLDDLLAAAVERAARAAVRDALAEVQRHGTGPLIYGRRGVAEVLDCGVDRADELIASGVLGPVITDGPGRGRQVTRDGLVAYVRQLERAATRATPRAAA